MVSTRCLICAFRSPTVVQHGTRCATSRGLCTVSIEDACTPSREAIRRIELTVYLVYSKSDKYDDTEGLQLRPYAGLREMIV